VVTRNGPIMERQSRYANSYPTTFLNLFHLFLSTVDIDGNFVKASDCFLGDLCFVDFQSKDHGYYNDDILKKCHGAADVSTRIKVDSIEV
jgi:hypothetical protein